MRTFVSFILSSQALDLDVTAQVMLEVRVVPGAVEQPGRHLPNASIIGMYRVG